jgi:hypothetical protein
MQKLSFPIVVSLSKPPNGAEAKLSPHETRKLRHTMRFAIPAKKREEEAFSG